MRFKPMLLGVFVLFRMSGCHQHPLTDYRPLDRRGMWSSSVEQLKNAEQLRISKSPKL